MNPLQRGLKYKLLDTKKFFLQVNGAERRFLHMATVGSGLREYILLMDTVTKKVYLNDITGGRLEEIESDDEFKEIYAFLYDKGIVIHRTDGQKQE